MTNPLVELIDRTRIGLGVAATPAGVELLRRFEKYYRLAEMSGKCSSLELHLRIIALILLDTERDTRKEQTP